MLQELLDDHGRTGAARVLGVDYRTVVANLEADRLSRRMRSAVQAYQESKAGQPEETGTTDGWTGGGTREGRPRAAAGGGSER